MRANTTPSNGDTSGFGSALSSSTSWTGSHDQGHASAPTTTQPSPSSMHNGTAAQMHMSLSSHGTASPTYSQQQQYGMTQAQQLARPAADRRQSAPISLNNVNGHSDPYGATNLGAATANGGLVNGARKVSGLKRSWNDADDLNGSATASPPNAICSEAAAVLPTATSLRVTTRTVLTPRLNALPRRTR